MLLASSRKNLSGALMHSKISGWALSIEAVGVNSAQMSERLKSHLTNPDQLSRRIYNDLLLTMLDTSFEIAVGLWPITLVPMERLEITGDSDIGFVLRSESARFFSTMLARLGPSFHGR